MLRTIENSSKPSFKKLCFVSLILYFAFVSSIYGSDLTQSSTTPLPNQVTTESLNQIKKLDKELHSYGSSLSEFILNCSYVQDALYTYLLKADDVQEYHRGMELFHKHMDSFRSIGTYLSDAFNFYRGTHEPSKPQEVESYFNGSTVYGYLNTFKLEGPLSPVERELYFSQENKHYLQDYIESPFILDAESIVTLESDTLYNFVLLPDGTIRAALERPGEREYHERDKVIVEAFHYPNHTILAGNPHQVVITAGAFVMHKHEGKRLFFISCKSGHFQPSYDSLTHMRVQLSNLGINPYTVICVNDVDLSEAVLKTYNGAKIPLFITKYDCQKLFDIALDRWNKTSGQINKKVLQELAEGNFSLIDMNLIEEFKQQRSEATYMRSAFRLFSAPHAAPEKFSEFARRFGKLKDLMKHFSWKELNYNEIQNQASELLKLIDSCEYELIVYDFTPADDASFYDFLRDNISYMRDLLQRESLTKSEFHDLKKLSRELCALFLYQRDDFRTKGKGYFISNTAANAFYQINDLMAKTDTIYASQEPGNIRVKVPRKIGEKLLQNLNHLGIAPPSFRLEFTSTEAKKMINKSKDIYFTSYSAENTLRELSENYSEGYPVDYPKLIELFTENQRNAEFARNTAYFLDVTHEIPDMIDELITLNRKMISFLKEKNIRAFLDNSERMRELLYNAPSLTLETILLTDHESFTGVLTNCLSHFSSVLDYDVIPRSQADEIAENVQALRDFVNLYRRIGLVNKNSDMKNQLPMVCYDRLEELADILLKGLKKGKNVIITPIMKQSAETILSRLAIQAHVST